MKCTQYGLYEQATFKYIRVRPCSGVEALDFSVLPLPPALTRAMLVGGI